MMTKNSDPVIEVSGLGKKYTISHEQKAEYGSIRDTISTLAKKPFEKKGQQIGAKEKSEEFWALKDVSFSVNRGEIFGVIGRNGSGKSTLLKILSRIVTPTTGSVKIKGKTASLLEVGTGFHPELTGRENVFFNGSMLGMTRDEIGKKFDEIVQFAEIEKFLDTPVKFYSSGMYVRLAFSVAAHLSPDVLILDEVLAVGDAGFQEKSMKKILSTIEGGTTVLFVSHGMDGVRKICKRGLLLGDGGIEYLGDIEGAIEAYTGVPLQEISDSEIVTPERGGAHNIVVHSISLEGAKVTVGHSEPLRFLIRLVQSFPLESVRVDINILDKYGNRIICASNQKPDARINNGRFIFELKDHKLSAGEYVINVSILHGNTLEDFYPRALSFKINRRPSFLSGSEGSVYLKGSVVDA